MGRIEKTVFISYRRTDESWGLAIFQDLTQHGYDVFIDYDGIASGSFETAILENIKARAHFLVLLTPTALERCADPKDWMRREIEAALDSQRNIVPLMFAGFDFGTPAIASQLAGKLAVLKNYNGLEIPKARFFSSEMERLRNRFLNVQVDAVLHPASDSAQRVAKEQKDKATMVLGEALHQPSLSPQELRKQEEAAAQHHSEEEARQRAAEEERRRKRAEPQPKSARQDMLPLRSDDLLTGPLTIGAVLKGAEHQCIGDAYPTGDHGVHFVFSVFNANAFDFLVHEVHADVLGYAPLNLDYLIHGVGATDVRRYFRATIRPEIGSYVASYVSGERQREFVTIPPGKSEAFDVEITTPAEGLYDVSLRLLGGSAGKRFDVSLDSWKRRVAFFNRGAGYMVDRGGGRMLTYEEYSLEMGLSGY